MLVPILARSPAAKENVAGCAQFIRRHDQITLDAAVVPVASGAGHRIAGGSGCWQVFTRYPGIGAFIAR